MLRAHRRSNSLEKRSVRFSQQLVPLEVCPGGNFCHPGVEIQAHREIRLRHHAGWLVEQIGQPKLPRISGTIFDAQVQSHSLCCFSIQTAR